MELQPLAEGPRSNGARPSPSWLEGQDLQPGSSAAARAAADRRRIQMWLLSLAVASAVALLMAGSALSLAAGARTAAEAAAGAAADAQAAITGTTAGWRGVRRIAFGSCTSYDVRPQPIWTRGVIPAAPDAWVWLGDMAYMDDPLIDCSQVPHYPLCNCTSDFMHRPPSQCAAGDPEHARLRMGRQLQNFEYQAYMAYSCPGHMTAGRGAFPPPGSDPAACPRPILGVYDDHDSGWNNGDGRNPAKAAIKNIYLDALGEPAASPRRSGVNGLQWHYTLNAGSGGQEIDLIMLDERWFREPMPCSRRQAWCEQVLARNRDAPDVAWCKDFLLTGGLGGTGSCCRKDDQWEAWCSQPASQQHPQHADLCDPTSPGFAAAHLLLAADNATVVNDSSALWGGQQAGMWERLLDGSASSLCEVLGREQRLWLRDVLAASTAPLVLVASGSVLAGGVGRSEGTPPTTCSGDDWLCYSRAQVNLLHTLAREAAGCVVVLTGDYHFSDLKAILPGGSTGYAADLQTASLAKPVYQAMSSGMTDSTAHYGKQACAGSFREDVAGLRPLGSCSIVTEPAFGMVEVDWRGRVVELSIRNASTSDVARDPQGQAQRLRVSLDTCALLK